MAPHSTKSFTNVEIPAFISGGPKLNARTIRNIHNALDSAVKVKNGLPNLSFHVVDKSGEALVSIVSGSHGLDDPRPISYESVYWLASCTKVITAIACMQLVEAGKLDLDSHEQLYRLCPELANKKVLMDDGSLVRRTNNITLRQLLAHTAGFGYPFCNAKLKRWTHPGGIDDFGGDVHSTLALPLVHQPGEKYTWGVSMEWVGVAIERMTGLTLEQYFQRYIFDPMEIKSIAFSLNPKMKNDLVGMHSKSKTGEIVQVHHPLCRRIALGDRPPADTLDSGATGLFGCPLDFVDILAMLNNDGISPKTNRRILQSSTVYRMLSNAIPRFPDFARGDRSKQDAFLDDAKPYYTNQILEYCPQPGNPPQGWSLANGLVLNEPQPGTCAAGSNLWGGIPNVYWFLDKETGVAGMLAASVLPFGDKTALKALDECKRAFYAGLAEMNSGFAM